MASKLTLTFIAIGIADESIDYLGTGSVSTFKATRSKSRQLTIEGSASIDAQVSKFKDAFDLDYNRGKDYEVTIVGQTLEIEHIDNTHFDSFVDVTHNLTATITTGVTTTTQRTPVVVTTVFTPASADVCNKISTVVSFNQTINEVTITQFLGILLGTVTLFEDLTFDTTVTPSFDAHRIGHPLRITVTIDGDGTYAYLSWPPFKLRIDELIVDSNGFGGLVTIITNVFVGSDENMFAISDISADEFLVYQASNQFNSITPGTYLAYCKDKYNCVKTEQFVIVTKSTGQYTVPDWFFFSGKNSIRMANRVLPDGQLTANPFNFLACEFPDQVAPNNILPFYAQSQVAQMQFKSSYDIHSVVIECEGKVATIEPLISKKTSNLNRQVYLEGITTWNATYGRLEIAFKPGDVYNSSGAVIGTHVFDDFLPAYYQVGTAIKINGEASTIGVIEIRSGVEYAITFITTNNPEASTIVESTHVALPYETYHFDVDMQLVWNIFYAAEVANSPLRAIFTITVKAKNTGVIVVSTPWDEQYYSERVEVFHDALFSAKRAHVMEYWSETSDGDIDYTDFIALSVATLKDNRIHHLKNLEFTRPPKRISNAEIDTEKLDNRPTKLDYKTMKVYELYLKEMPSEQAGLVMDAFDESEYIILDGMLVTTIGPTDIDNKGQLSKVTPRIVVIGLANEAGILSTGQSFSGLPNADGFYPVVV